MTVTKVEGDQIALVSRFSSVGVNAFHESHTVAVPMSLNRHACSSPLCNGDGHVRRTSHWTMMTTALRNATKH